jgi:hypothetical protein
VALVKEGLLPLLSNIGLKGSDNMKKWEYKVENYNLHVIYNSDEGMQNQLSKLGNEGWELVSAIPLVEGSGSEGDVSIETSEFKFVFKREV